MKTKNITLTREAAPHSKQASADIKANIFADLIPVISGQIGGRETNLVSAKSLHKALGVGRVFSSWITSRIDEYDFIPGIDYFGFDSPDLRNQSLNIDQLTPERVFIPKRGRPEKDYYLSLGMAKEVAMIERSEQGRAIRKYFIQCEEALLLTAPAIAAKYRRQLKARLNAANNFKAMCQALDAARAELGKTTLHHHYSTESNMIAKIVLGGITAKQWAQLNNIQGEPRDSMNAAQLEHLNYLESTNTTLIDMGMDYHARKAELTRLSQKWLAKRLEADNGSH